MLKQAICDKKALQAFTHSLRSALTPQTLVYALTRDVVTDPTLTQQLSNAIGKKADKPMPTRLADELAASMLGFRNTHEMFAYYEEDKKWYGTVFEVKDKYGESSFTIYAPNNMSLTPADVVHATGLHFDPSRTEDEFVEHDKTKGVSPDDINEYDLTISLKCVSGVCIIFPVKPEYADFTMTNDVFGHHDDVCAASEHLLSWTKGSYISPMFDHAIDNSFFTSEGGKIRDVLLAPLMDALPQYDLAFDAVAKKDAHVIQGDVHDWQWPSSAYGNIGIMLDANGLWMMVYRLSDGIPLAMSAIHLHNHDPRRSLLSK